MKHYTSFAKLAAITVLSVNSFISNVHAAPALNDPNIWTGGAGTSAWGTNTNWSKGTFPSAAGVNVLFDDTDVVLGGKSIGLGANRTIGSLENTSLSSFSITGNTLIFNNSGNGSQLIHNGVGMLTIGSAVSLGDSLSTYVDGASGTLTMSGVISGTNSAYSFTKTGDGRLILSTANTYTGATIVEDGVLELTGSGNLTGTSGVSLSEEAILNFTGGTTIAFSKIISGDGEVIVDRTGTLALTFSGANTYTGATTINSGAVTISTLGSIGSSEININGGTLTLQNAVGISADAVITVNSGATFTLTNGFTTSRGIAGTGTISIGATKTLMVNNANDTKITANIASTTGILTKTGAGTLTLSGTNAYTGMTNINGGKLIIAGNHTGSTAAITVNGGDLDITGSIVNGAVTVTNGTVTLAGTKGTGMVTLNSGGIFNYATTKQTTSIGTVNVNNGGLFNLQDGSSGFLSNNALNVYAGGEFRVNTDYTRTAAIGGNAAGSIVIATGKTLTFSNASGSLAITPGIIGTGTVDKIGAGTFTLNGINTYTGATTVSSGVLSLGATGLLNLFNGRTIDIASGATFTINGGTLRFDESMSASGMITGLGTFSVGTNGVIFDTNGFDGEFDRGFSGKITKIGEGTLTLSGISTSNGAIAINEGILKIANTASGKNSISLTGAISGTGNLFVNFVSGTDVFVLNSSNNTTGFTGTARFENSTFTLKSNYFSNATFVGATGNTTTVSGATNLGNLILDGGKLIFNGTISTDALTLNSGIIQSGTGLQTSASIFSQLSDDFSISQKIIAANTITGSLDNFTLLNVTGNEISADNLISMQLSSTATGFYEGGQLAQRSDGLYVEINGALKELRLTGAYTISDAGLSGDQVFSALISGTSGSNPAGLTVNAAGNITFSHENTVYGYVRLQSTAGGGIIFAGANNALGRAQYMNLSGAVTYDLQGYYQSYESIFQVGSDAKVYLHGGHLENVQQSYRTNLYSGSSTEINGELHVDNGALLDTKFDIFRVGSQNSLLPGGKVFIEEGGRIRSFQVHLGGQSSAGATHYLTIEKGGILEGTAVTDEIVPGSNGKHAPGRPTPDTILNGEWRSVLNTSPDTIAYWENYEAIGLDGYYYQHYNQWIPNSLVIVGLFASNSILDIEGEIKNYQAFFLAYGRNTNAILNLNGGSIQVTENIHIAAEGTAVLNVNNGGIVTNTGKFQIATQTTGDGTVVVNAGGLIDVQRYSDNTIDIPGQIYVGGWGKALLDINGGTVNGDIVCIGCGANETYTSDGTLLLHNNGILTAGSIEAGYGKYQLTVNGGTIVAKQNNDDFITGFTNSASDGTLKIDNDGLTLNTQAYNVGINAGNSFSGTGGLTKTGSGTLTVRSVNTYTGKTTVSDGGMVIASGGSLGNTNVEVGANTFLTVNGIIENDSKTTIVNQGGTLYGTGVLNGNTTVSGVLSPGDGNGKIGTLSFANSLALNSTASVRIEIDHQTLDFDKLIIGGNMDLGGAILDIDLAGLSLFDTRIDLFTASSLTGEWGSGYAYTDTDNRVWQFGFENGIGYLSIGTIIPEPSAYGLFLALSAMASVGLRRRRDLKKFKMTAK